MTFHTKIFFGLGCVFLLIAIILKITWFPFILISGKPLRPIEMVILANTFFILAILFKK